MEDVYHATVDRLRGFVLSGERVSDGGGKLYALRALCDATARPGERAFGTVYRNGRPIFRVELDDTPRRFIGYHVTRKEDV